MKSVYRIFYLVLGYVVFRNFNSYKFFDATTLFFEPSGILNLVSRDLLSYDIFRIAYWILLLFCALNVLKTNFILRIVVAFLFLALNDFRNSFGKINHGLHGWLYAAIVLIFLNQSKKNREEYVFEIVQSLILATYFTAGLWKLRTILEDGHVFRFFMSMKDHVAYAIAEGHGPSLFVMNSGLLHPKLLALGYLLVFLFQMSSIFPVIYIKMRWVWGVMAVLFHVATGVVMNIWFIDQIYLVSLFLIAAPSFMQFTFLKYKFSKIFRLNQQAVSVTND